MRGLVRVAPLCAALAAAGVMIGCRTPAAAPRAVAGAAYAPGASEAVVDASPPHVVAAAKAAMLEIGATLVSGSANDLDGEVVGRLGRGTRVSVLAERVSDRASRVVVRVGASGGDERQAVILQKIRERV